MKIIILEGIATSGKTTLKDKLTEYFRAKGQKTLVIGEEETLLPILHNTEREVAIKLLNEVISKALNNKADVIIFDRLYFTHIFRTNSRAEDFLAVIDLLSKHQTLIVLLTIEKAAIGDRIFEAMKQRDKAWVDFVNKKGTPKEIVKYYQEQQDKLITLVDETKLPKITIDMTDNDYDKVVAFLNIEE